MKGARASRTTIALKLGMAVSGFIFLGFVLAHMYGNLKAFAGHDAFNEYAHHLRVLGEPMLPHEGALWIIRLGDGGRATEFTEWYMPRPHEG